MVSSSLIPSVGGSKTVQRQKNIILNKRNHLVFSICSEWHIHQLMQVGDFSPSCEKRPAELGLDKNGDIVLMAPYYFFKIKNIFSFVLRTAKNKWFCMSPEQRQVVRSALPCMLFSHAENARVAKLQGGLYV